MKVTVSKLNWLRESERNIRCLELEIEAMKTTDAGIGNSVIMDYRDGFGRPQSVVGFDGEKYDRKMADLEKKKKDRQFLIDWIGNIEDDQVRMVFTLYYIDQLRWKQIAKKMGMPHNEAYPRVCLRDAYLKRVGIK